MNFVTIFIIGALKKYNELNGELPEPVIVYRDGVGDGQVRRFVVAKYFFSPF